MGLKADLDADVTEALLGDLADATKPLIHTTSTKTQSMDDWYLNRETEVTDTPAQSGVGVFTGYSVQEVDGRTILSTDTKLITMVKWFTQEPKPDDRINDMSVISVRKDPTDTVYTIQLRKS